MLKLKLQYFGHLMWRTDSLERPWCWERLKAGGEGDDRGWDGWMASLTRWTWVWANSGSWRWTGKPGVLQSMGSQRVRHDWATELNWTDLKSQLIGKDPDVWKDWRQKEKRMAEGERVRLHHWLDFGREFEQTLGYSEGQGRLIL